LPRYPPQGPCLRDQQEKPPYEGTSGLIPARFLGGRFKNQKYQEILKNAPIQLVHILVRSVI
jgi:hypothetical protein